MGAGLCIMLSRMKNMMICLAVFGLLNNLDINIQATESVDTEAPVIVLKTEKITIKTGDTIDFDTYVEVSDDSDDDCRVMALGVEETKETGNHDIEIIALDKSGNLASKTLQVNVLNEEDYQLYLEKFDFKKNSRDMLNRNMSDLKGDANQDAYDLALNFLGAEGNCFYIAQSYIKAYLGNYSITDSYPIEACDALPGDIIYYAEGGVGFEHWAVYLGGNSALHGNFQGITVIGKVYLNTASEPQFLRINR